MPTMPSSFSFSSGWMRDRLLRPLVTKTWQASHLALPPHLLMTGSPTPSRALRMVVPAATS